MQLKNRRTYIHTAARIRVFTHTHTHSKRTHGLTTSHTSRNTHTHTSTHNQHTHPETYAHTGFLTHTQTHTNTHKHTHTYTRQATHIQKHTYTHKHTHTHTHTSRNTNTHTCLTASFICSRPGIQKFLRDEEGVEGVCFEEVQGGGEEGGGKQWNEWRRRVGLLKNHSNTTMA